MTVSRNDPCPCGSGLKYKKCCGKLSDEPAASQAPVSSLSEIDFEPLIALFRAGHYAELEHHARELLERDPDSGFAWKLLGTALGVQNKDALSALQKAATLLPGDVDAHNNLGNALQDLGQPDAAIASYRRAIALKPDFASAHYNLGISLRSLGQLDAAVACCRRALEIKPDYAEAHNNLGKALQDIGRQEEAMASFRLSLGIKPDCLDANRAFLTALVYQPTLTAETFFEAHLACAARLGAAVASAAPVFSNSRNPFKKLRVAYVSSDFRNHPVGRNTMPLIERHDRQKIEVYLYGDVKRPDGLTDWFRGAADNWRSIAGLSDEAAAEMIRRDEVDILVLLAGRFDENRPLIAAHRAAPVQVSLYDAATSGLKTMDYFFADINLVPKNTTEKFTERVVRLPTYYVHGALKDVPDVSPLPAKKNGYITFGSFNNPAKLNEQVVALWAGVLNAVPNSRLLLKYKTLFGVESVRQHYFRLFREYGVEAHRIELASGQESMEHHLARYSQIDVVLDPFPFTGATATFESLWMGVPVITLMGERFMARWSGAMLRKIGLGELVATSKDEYIEIAMRLAADIDHLSVLRTGLRQRVTKSPLCDEGRRAHQFERAYRWMWAKWCVEQAAG